MKELLVDFVEMDKLCQGKVIVNLGNNNDENDKATIAVPMMWVRADEVNEMQKTNIQAVVDAYKCEPEDCQTVMLVAKTLSTEWYYVGMFTLNKDRTYLGQHDLVEIPKLSNVELRKL